MRWRRKRDRCGHDPDCGDVRGIGGAAPPPADGGFDPQFVFIPGFTIIVEPDRSISRTWGWLIFSPYGQENGSRFATEAEAWQGALAWAIWRHSRAMLGVAIDDPSDEPWPYDPSWR